MFFRRWICELPDLDATDLKKIAHKLRKRLDVAIAIVIDNKVVFLTTETIEAHQAVDIIKSIMRLQDHEAPFVENVDRQLWDRSIIPHLKHVERKMKRKLEKITLVSEQREYQSRQPDRKRMRVT